MSKYIITENGRDIEVTHILPELTARGFSRKDVLKAHGLFSRNLPFLTPTISVKRIEKREKKMFNVPISGRMVFPAPVKNAVPTPKITPAIKRVRVAYWNVTNIALRITGRICNLAAFLRHINQYNATIYTSIKNNPNFLIAGTYKVERVTKNEDVFNFLVKGI